jgi:hypothetical protein
MNRPASLAVAFLFLWAAPIRADQQPLPAGPDAQFFKIYQRALPITAWPLEQTQQAIGELAGLEPASDQSRLPEILRRVGENLQSFVTNFVNTTALETIEQTRRGRHGETSEHIVQQFRYLMLMQPAGGAETLSEYRTDLRGREAQARNGAQNFLTTAGFAALCLFFAPVQQSWSDFRYLGRQKISGQRAEVVAFAEHVEPTAVMGRFALGKTSVPILVQGVAWIGDVDYQIRQIRTDLRAPLSGISLWRVTTVARFSSKQFQGGATAFWLPQQVQVDVEQGRFIFVNRHSYSDYQLFKVDVVPAEREPDVGAAAHP